MKSSKPPMVATWLLEHFLSNPADNPLIGDLVERYTQGRSRIWYWKQVIVALLIGSWRDISTHKLLTLRGLAVGWVIVLVEGRLWFPLWQYLTPLSRKWPIVFGMSPIPGFALLMVWCAMFALPGWAIARFHRPHHMTIVLVFTVWGELMRLGLIGWSYELLLSSFGHPRYLPYLAGSVVPWLLPPICTVVAGLWGGRSARDQSLHTPGVVA